MTTTTTRTRTFRGGPRHGVTETYDAPRAAKHLDAAGQPVKTSAVTYLTPGDPTDPLATGYADVYSLECGRDPRSRHVEYVWEGLPTQRYATVLRTTPATIAAWRAIDAVSARPGSRFDQPIIGEALACAVAALLPGLHVADDGTGDPAIWADGVDPARPELILQRTASTSHLFDLLAALLPDRTEDDLRTALADSTAGLTADLGDFTQYTEED